MVSGGSHPISSNIGYQTNIDYWMIDIKSKSSSHLLYYNFILVEQKIWRITIIIININTIILKMIIVIITIIRIISKSC